MTTIGGIEQLDAREAHARIREGTPLLDVREADERRLGHVPGSLWVPLAEVPGRADDLPEDLVVMCAAGVRSQQAARFLQTRGHRVANLMHGIQGWARMGLPLETGDG